MSSNIIQDIKKYYTEKVITHGATPQGVDWNGIESQEKRFEQLLKLIDREINENYTLLDYGCGFGSLFSYLKNNNISIRYIGYDISNEMLKKAIEIFDKQATWLNVLDKNFKSDYVVASGLFNVRLNQNLLDWEKYVIKTLDKINKIAKKGFAFNLLTSYSDQEFMKNYLYYASPEYYFKHCKLKYSKQVSLLHDYDLYEFTIIIKK